MRLSLRLFCLETELKISVCRTGKIRIDRRNEMFEELGISFGTALIVLLTLYFIVKWAVKNGIKEAYRDITGKVTTEDIEAEQICNELGLNEEEK